MGYTPNIQVPDRISCGGVVYKKEDKKIKYYFSIDLKPGIGTIIAGIYPKALNKKKKFKNKLLRGSLEKKRAMRLRF